MKATPITLALVAAFAAVSVQAQSLTKPSVDVRGQINATGSLTGAITQEGGGGLSLGNGGLGPDGALNNPTSRTAPSGIAGGQRALIGGVAGNISAGSITANGTVRGSITQTRVGLAEGLNEQSALIGSTSETTANTVRTTGTVNGFINQLAGAVGSLGNVQQVLVGSTDRVTARNINAEGTVNGSVTQVNGAVLGAANEQLLVVGGARNVDAANLTLRGTIGLGGVSQFTGNTGAAAMSQVANVGGAQNAQAQNITTNGSVTGLLNQIAVSALSVASSQQIVVGGVQGASVNANGEAK